MKTAPEKAEPWCRLLSPASVTRRNTAASRRERGARGVGWAGRGVSSKHAHNHFVKLPSV